MIHVLLPYTVNTRTLQNQPENVLKMFLKLCLEIMNCMDY